MENYGPTKENKFIMYLDANNLYGWAMSQYLPQSKFRWLKNVDNFDVNSTDENSPIGFILEVDLDYHDELHELHNGYPLASKKLAVHYDVFSNYCQKKKNANKDGIKVGNVKKLVPNLVSKTNYVVYYRNLKLYLSLGMKLTKIQNILKFKLSEWLQKIH